MHTSSALKRRLGYLLFAIGFLAGLWLLGGIAWANLESSLFGSGDVGDNLSSLRCSLIVTPNETAQARVTLENPLDRPSTDSCVGALPSATCCWWMSTGIRSRCSRVTKRRWNGMFRPHPGCMAGGF